MLIIIILYLKEKVNLIIDFQEKTQDDIKKLKEINYINGKENIKIINLKQNKIKINQFNEEEDSDCDDFLNFDNFLKYLLTFFICVIIICKYILI